MASLTSGDSDGRCFGQISPITTTLRNVLKDYSGAQLLNEQVSAVRNARDSPPACSLTPCYASRRTAAERGRCRREELQGVAGQPLARHIEPFGAWNGRIAGAGAAVQVLK